MGGRARTLEESRQLLCGIARILERVRHLRDESERINKTADALGRTVEELLCRQAQHPLLNPYHDEASSA